MVIKENFLKQNAIGIICLILTIGGVLINVGINKSEISNLQLDVSEMKVNGTAIAQRNAASLSTLQKDVDGFKVDTKEKIRDIEKSNKESVERVNDKLDMLNRQMAVVVAWIEEQKRHAGK